MDRHRRQSFKGTTELEPPETGYRAQNVSEFIFLQYLFRSIYREPINKIILNFKFTFASVFTIFNLVLTVINYFNSIINYVFSGRNCSIFSLGCKSLIWDPLYIRDRYVRMINVMIGKETKYH